ncbi:MAG TPA: class I SAM-dependent methyltransferase [Flavobacteriales bacterium]|nr:class I SAM-dependent methyltransferase [Flavobacteriales bacterium]HRO40058.1 class I SAM-dependent methyltransferase [Flavobacteriales bacterium]HRQ83625.1 class I SAM-dependent methyltransferase [Flavobacteriales bacterium]
MARTEFNHDQFSEAYPPGIERSWWHTGRNRIIGRSIARHLPRDARILEIGCGTGIVTAALRRMGFDVSGVDLGEPKTGLHALEHLTLRTNALELPPDTRSRFTAIGVFDVIEHIEDAPAFMKAIFAAFPNVQHIIVTVPARQELWTSFDDHYGHFRRYDLALLRNEFQQIGVRTLHAGYFFHGVYPAILLNNLLRGRQRNINFKAPGPGLPSAVNGIIGALFSLEAMMLPNSIPGSSIIAVAQRS